MNRRLFLHAAAGLSVAPLCGRASAQNSGLRIGLTAVILADQAAFLSRWSDYLSQKLETSVAFIARDSYQSILDLLFARQLDAAWICGYPYVRHQSQLRLLAIPLYQRQPLYQSYLIRHKSDSSVQAWSDLRGKVFAYSDPLSNSGWLVAQGQFAAAGIQRHDLLRAFFAHGHRNVAEAVAARLAHAGAIDGYVWETMRRQRMNAVEQTAVVWKSEPHGFPPLVSPVSAANPKIETLQRTLLAMHDDEFGRSLLQELNLDGFTEGTTSVFDSIRKLAQRVPGSGVAA